MALDPKVKNLIIFLVKNVAGLSLALYLFVKFSGVTDYIRLFGILVLLIAAWRIFLFVHRKYIQKPKKPLELGKWAIVTGSTSGIGKEFADYLAKKGSSLLIVSRTESRLKEQAEELAKAHNVEVKYLAYDFTKLGPEKKEFYAKLDVVCKTLHADGGIGLLINNVGTANEIPKSLEEMDEDEIEGMISCNIYSTINMTRAVLPYMKERKNGCVVSISSGSGNNMAPFLTIYSSTKAFMTQFSRSMKVECWGSGVDFLVVTPFYVVSNLYKRKTGTIIAPMPIELIKGTMAQVGKQWVFQSHGYWFHGVLGNIGMFWWGAAQRNRKMMVDNRKRFDERQASKAAAAAGDAKKDK